MANITLKGNPINTLGNLPEIGSKALEFALISSDLSTKKLSDFKGKNVILNVFPSIDTSVCATSTRKFNQEASSLEDTVVICISRDLPFAQSRFCGSEGLNNVIMLSEMKNYDFSDSYQVKIIDGPLEGLISRAIIVINKEGNIIYTEQVPEITQEPDYQNALNSLK